MKKVASTLVLALSCYFISCMQKTGNSISPAAQKNLDASHAVTKCFESKDFSKLGDYIADDAVDHGGQNGDIKGLDNLKAEFAKYVANVENQKTEIIKELADDDYVMSWARYTGTMTAAGMGLKAGDKYDMKMMDVSRFKDGKAVEHWVFMTPDEMMKMMPPQQQPAMVMDTVKKAPKK